MPPFSAQRIGKSDGIVLWLTFPRCLNHRFRSTVAGRFGKTPKTGVNDGEMEPSNVPSPRCTQCDDMYRRSARGSILRALVPIALVEEPSASWSRTHGGASPFSGQAWCCVETAPYFASTGSGLLTGQVASFASTIGRSARLAGDGSCEISAWSRISIAT